MSDDDRTALELAELADASGVSVRTIRFYIQQGLLPAADRGAGTRYGPEYLDRLRLIRRLQREHLPLAEIRRRLEELSDHEIAALARSEPGGEKETAADYIRSVLSEGVAKFTSPSMRLSSASPQANAPMPAAPGAARAQYDRITLAPDVELHVRRPLTRAANRQVERLLDAARRIFEEESP